MEINRGQLLWNVVYDAVLSLLTLYSVEVIEFADDNALVVQAQIAEELISKANRSINNIVKEIENELNIEEGSGDNW